MTSSDRTDVTVSKELFASVDLTPPEEVCGYYSRHLISPATNMKVWTKRVETRIDIDQAKVIELVFDLWTAADGLADAHLQIESREAYGDVEIQVMVIGWKVATPEEELWIERAVAELERQQRLQEEKQVEQLKTRRPELFLS